MKSKELVVDSEEELKPQQSLEKILQLEIEIAEKIAAAKEKADKKVTKTQDNIADQKNKIIEDARLERDRTIKEGIAKSQQDADEKVENAKLEAEKFTKVGKKFEKEAAEHIMNLIIGLNGQEEK